MKTTTLLRTSAQLNGMIAEVKAKRKLLVRKLKNGGEVGSTLYKLELDMDNIDFGLDLVNELKVADN
jgi:hypothetical protein